MTTWVTRMNTDKQTTVDEARAALLERLSQVIADRAKVTWDPHPDGRMRTIDSDYLARDIEAEARAAALDVEVLAEALEVIGARWDPDGMELAPLVAAEYARLVAER